MKEYDTKREGKYDYCFSIIIMQILIMTDYIIMGGILLFLFLLLAYGAQYIPSGNNNFFDQYNSKVMRGFWCLIVILVHIPQRYQNIIQDMIGSFAYIGVTFFFMTSAYGLSISMQRTSNLAKHFWRKRLLKLLIPNWMKNAMFFCLFFLVWEDNNNIIKCLEINGWIKWLLACYIAFWSGHVINRNEKYRKTIVIVFVSIFSMCFYYLDYLGVVKSTTWCTESIGFIWGIVLFSNFDKIKTFFCQKWVMKVVFTCLISLVLGLSYIKYKTVLFWGDYILKIILGVSILSFVLILNSKIRIGNKVSWFLGDISFEIYLVHGAVFELVSKTFSTINSGLFILLSIILSVILATVVHKLSKKVLRAIC